MSQQKLDMPKIQSEAIKQFKNIIGVEGIGARDNLLRIYIRNPKVKEQLPQTFQGVDIEFIITGDITAQIFTN